MARHTAAEGGPDKAPAIDCYGNGEDLPAVKASSRAKQLPLTFHGAKDHLDDSMHEYKVGRRQGFLLLACLRAMHLCWPRMLT